MQREEIELTGSGRLHVAGFGGEVIRTEELRLTWDGYREDGPYRVFWNTAGGSGVHHVLKGRLINSAAISPAGDLVAVSVSTGLNIGDIRDSIYVLQAGDGVEVFRRYLPLYTRTKVVFPSDDLMAYTAGDQVVVLRVIR
jgi:hypothetical protein